MSDIMSALGVRRAKAALSSGCKPHPATAPAGSNRSSYGGDEIAEAFGMRATNWWQRECAGRNASERRASLEKDDARAGPTTLSEKADTNTVGGNERGITPSRCAGVGPAGDIGLGVSQCATLRSTATPGRL